MKTSSPRSWREPRPQALLTCPTHRFCHWGWLIAGGRCERSGPKPRRKLSWLRWSRLGGDAKTPRGSWKSALKPCITNCASTGSPRKVTICSSSVSRCDHPHPPGDRLWGDASTSSALGCGRTLPRQPTSSSQRNIARILEGVYVRDSHGCARDGDLDRYYCKAPTQCRCVGYGRRLSRPWSSAKSGSSRHSSVALEARRTSRGRYFPVRSSQCAVAGRRRPQTN